MRSRHLSKAQKKIIEHYMYAHVDQQRKERNYQEKNINDCKQMDSERCFIMSDGMTEHTTRGIRLRHTDGTKSKEFETDNLKNRVIGEQSYPHCTCTLTILSNPN